MTLSQWDQFAYDSYLMQIFRDSMFDLIIPNLKQIGLLSPRIEPLYRSHGLLRNDLGKSAPDMKQEDYLLKVR